MQAEAVAAITFYDWLVFAAVLAATFMLVVYGTHRKHKASSAQANFLDYMLMGRQLTLPLFIATLAATWYGGIFGVTQFAFEKGIYAFLIQGIFWYVTYLLFAFLIAPAVRKFNAMTLPQLVTQMFGIWSGRLSSIFNFFNVLPIAYAISLGIFLQTLTRGDFFVCTALGLLAIICYSALSGFRAVVYSDVIQFIAMYVAVAVVLLFSYLTYGGYDFLQQHLPASHFTLLSDEPLLPTLVWGFIALTTLVDPNFYQRVFAARSLAVARKGIVCTTCIWITFDLCTVLGAMYARAAYPNLDAAQAYLTYGLTILPVGLKGLLLAGICATILSTMDSYLFIASTSVSFDMFGYQSKSRWPHVLALVLTGLLTLTLVQLFHNDIPQVWKVLGTYSAACLLLPVTYGYLSRHKLRDWQFVTICLAAATGVTVWKLFPANLQLDEMYVGIAISAAGIAIVRLCKLTS